uniref:Sulfatase-modifying factor enzyme-like domain-containing protein n=1 Tax=Magnetococcus massalia (strain MO-1) TaxID=451514 RepID=A0A1S7LHH5_MAGMO|nr:conserved protein of unknown function. Containing sulphatase-modifying factor domain [Candidatus Magnetococcus massalia]
MKERLNTIFRLKAKRAFQTAAQVHFSMIAPLLTELGWATDNPTEVESLLGQTTEDGKLFPSFYLKLEEKVCCNIEVYPQGSLNKESKPQPGSGAVIHLMTDGRVCRLFHQLPENSEPTAFKAFEIKPEKADDIINLFAHYLKREVHERDEVAEKLKQSANKMNDRKLEALRGLVSKAQAICAKPPHPTMEKAMIHLIKKAGWSGITKVHLNQVLSELKPKEAEIDPIFGDVDDDSKTVMGSVHKTAAEGEVDPILGTVVEGGQSTAPQPAKPKELETWTEPVTGMIFIKVEGGSFQMGSPDHEKGRQRDEGPLHEVTLDSFWLSKYPIILPQWQQVMDGGPRMQINLTKGPEDGGPPILPADKILINEIPKFVDKLVMLGGGNSRLRLPTEAEWEYACRAGTNWPTFVDPNGSDNFDDYLWYVNNSGREIQPVGMKKPNPWGFHDMLGLVWEWVSDSFSMYSAAAATNPTGPDREDGVNIRRGGSYRSNAKACRSARRNSAKVDELELQNTGGCGVRFARFEPKD